MLRFIFEFMLLFLLIMTDAEGGHVDRTGLEVLILQKPR